MGAPARKASQAAAEVAGVERARAAVDPRSARATGDPLMGELR